MYCPALNRISDRVFADFVAPRSGLALLGLDAQKVGDSETDESANQRYNAEN
jgi:hypothetical protein